jgi:hypothetical protein
MKTSMPGRMAGHRRFAALGAPYAYSVLVARKHAMSMTKPTVSQRNSIGTDVNMAKPVRLV